MFTCSQTDRYTTRILAGLVLAVTVVVGSLTHAIANLQTFA